MLTLAECTRQNTCYDCFQLLDDLESIAKYAVEDLQETEEGLQEIED